MGFARSWSLAPAMAMTMVMAAYTAAHAQPWAAGVTDAQKKTAQARLEEGNALFLERKYAEALVKYEEAIAAWKHPAIQFNVVRCLIQLDRPVEASDRLALALAYGAAPLDEGVYTEALSYQKLLANQIAEIEVSCEQQGVKLTLDGQPLLTCPGKDKRRVAPGPHQVVGTKDGHLTKTVEVVVVGGTTEPVELALVPLAQAAKIVHRWPTWIPWVVTGGGLVVAGLGGVLQWQAFGQMRAYDADITRNCSINGCDVAMTNEQLRQDAIRNNKIAISVITVGATAAVTGGVMLFLNRGRTVYEQPVDRRTRLDVVPQPGGGLVGVSGQF
jgi:tetratricopeptide (TPR) repeat protein